MDSFLFEEWFSTEFVQKVKAHLMRLKLPLKAILVLDNASTHPIDLSSNYIKVMFLPPDITSLVQPMDQGVIVVIVWKSVTEENFFQKFLNC